MGGRSYWLGMWRVPARDELERLGVIQWGLDENVIFSFISSTWELEPFK